MTPTHRITMEILKRAVDAQPDFLDGMLVEKAILLGAFNLVSNKQDWKAGIKADIVSAVCEYDAEVIRRAVEFFTATIPDITVIDGMIHVRGKGYRAGPAGDH